jgi:RimJ/RimL family protein N-acetyltransferase
MILLPIEIDASSNSKFYEQPECKSILDIYPAYYTKVGFNKPWIGYFASIDGHQFVGCGGYKGKPREGKVEIAYATFQSFEGQGFGKAICRELVRLSLKTDPSVRITARTLMENNPSTTILKSNGFTYVGIVTDEEDGEVWEWELKNAVEMPL